MNAATHTPGPWKTEQHEDHVMITDAATQMAAIARVGMRPSWDWDRRQQAHANARLIANAPALLAELRNLSASLNGLLGASEQREFKAIRTACDRADAVIAKVEGK